MRLYFDSSAVVTMFLAEPASAMVRAYISNARAVVWLNQWQECEARHAIRQKVVRTEIKEGVAVAALRRFDDAIVLRQVRVLPVEWPAAFDRAEQFSRRFGFVQPVRAFDLLHVAVAVMSGADRFVTLDAAQGEAARTAGMQVDMLRAQ